MIEPVLARRWRTGLVHVKPSIMGLQALTTLR